VEGFLKDCRVQYERFDDDASLIDAVARILAEGKVIGWCQGRFEWGPRALGNRSILADPRAASMKDRVNRTIKFREPFRPFAPAVLAERANDFFELDRFGGQGDPARFMLMTAQVRPQRRDQVQATTHEDGSSRMQKVEKSVNPRYYGLIERFGQLTGVPVLLNTSFNLKGEPIVNTPLEAYATFQRSELDALVMDRCLVRRKAANP
jgi:carbamoyltransferase